MILPLHCDLHSPLNPNSTSLLGKNLPFTSPPFLQKQEESALEVFRARRASNKAEGPPPTINTALLLRYMAMLLVT